MILSFGSSRHYRNSDESSDASEPHPVRKHRHRFEFLSYRTVLLIWAVLSAAWTGSVAYELYDRAQLQAEMARDVERDLNQGLTPVSCAGPPCGEATDNESNRWPDIASTYLRFGGVEMEEFALLPPIILLVAGLGLAFAAKRRRRSA